MTFLSPAFLWSLALLLPLAALFLIRVKPRARPTTAYFLWERLKPENRPSHLLRRLRDLFSLLLLAAAVTAAALGLADPRGEDEADTRPLLLVIDQSASMQRRLADGRTLLDHASEAAAGWIRALRGGRQAALMSVDSDLHQQARLTAHPPELLRALDQVQPGGLPLDEAVLAEFAETALASEESRVLFFTDAAKNPSLPEGLECIAVGPAGERPGNAGLVAADLAPSLTLNGAATLLARLVHDFPQAVTGRLELSRRDEAGGESLIRVLPLRLEPGQPRRLVEEVPEAEPGRWVLRWRPDAGADALALDDAVDLVLPAPRPVRVAVTGVEPFFAQQAVRAFASERGTLQVVTDAAQADVILSIGELAAEPAPGPARLIFRPEGDSPWWAEAPGAELDTPLPLLLEPEHPLLRFLDAASWDFRGARHLRPPAGSLVLARQEGDETPLIYLARRDGSRVAVVNLDPVASGFYLSPAFPVLVRNAALALAGRDETLPPQLRLGQRLVLPTEIPGEADRWTLETPAGAVKARAGAVVRVHDAGFYALPEADWTAGAALLAAGESISVGAAEKGALSPQPAGLGGRPWAWWLGLLAVGVITLESMLYHRRRVG
ncbi:MAG: VWA domain-containing protein [Verrucomicrobiales bacterium]|nr:VWA domain-containing protein [Verrucomicrobiales bacterium]